MSHQVLGDLDRQVQQKIASKYDVDKEREVQEWIETILQTRFPASFQQSLRSGVLLCHLFNTMTGSEMIKGISMSKTDFKQRDNISKYLNGCKKIGMNLVDLFDTQDLYDGKNMVSFINHMYCFSGYIASYPERFNCKGPFIGVRYAKKNPRIDGSALEAREIKTSAGIRGRATKVLDREEQLAAREKWKKERKIDDDDDGTLGELDRDVKKKIAAKYKPEQEAEVYAWIEAVRGKPLGTDGSLYLGLKSGIAMCEMFKKMFPNDFKKRINTKKMAFMQRENISNYLEACRSLGLKNVDLFDTQDLYDNGNIVSVINHFYSLSAFAKSNPKFGFKGPFIGIKHSNMNKRNFTEEQLREGQFIPSQQTQGSYGVLPKDYHVSLENQGVIRDVDYIRKEKKRSEAKAKKMYG